MTLDAINKTRIRRLADRAVADRTRIEEILDEVSAKVRPGDPDDEKEDLKEDVWAGVIPMRLEIGDSETPSPPRTSRRDRYPGLSALVPALHLI